MDGIALTRIARAVVLPAMLGISAANPARGDDPVASVAGPASTRPAATTPAPSSFGGLRSPMSYSARPAPTGPGSSRPSATADRPTRQPIASASTPALPSSWWPRPVGTTAPAVKDRGWQTSPMGGATVRRSSGGAPAARRPASDAAVRRIQAGAPDLTAAPLPAVGAGQPTAPPVMPPAVNAAELGGQSITLQLAMYGALTSNPDLVALRQGNPIAPSAEAVEVARRFPTTLNPTVWVNYRPITLIPPNTFGSTSPGGGSGASHHGGYYHFGQNYILFSVRQPIEMGHQTTHRYHIAKAAFEQQQWTVLQAELTTLVQTYRFFQTAAYRREKYRLAQQLADFNDRLAESLQRQLEAGQPQVTAADAALARVESHGSRQAVKAARQDYLTALADLRNQIGIPESAGAAEPLGEFTLPPYIPPVDEQTMVETALANRPDIRAAQAQIAGTHAAVNLAKGDRIPTQILGPQYAMDEAGVQYVGLIWVTPLPIVNNGRPLVAQREAEHHRAAVAAAQAQQRGDRAGAGGGGPLERRHRPGQRLVRAERGAGQGGRRAGATLRAAADRPGPADAGASAADPARQLAAGCRLGRHPGAGRPPAGPGHALANPRHARPGRARRRCPGRLRRHAGTDDACALGFVAVLRLAARPARAGRADRKSDGPRGPLNSEGVRAARRAGRRVLFEHRVASPGPCSVREEHPTPLSAEAFLRPPRPGRSSIRESSLAATLFQELSLMMAVLAGVGPSHAALRSRLTAPGRLCTPNAPGAANSMQPHESLESPLLIPPFLPMIRASCGESDNRLCPDQPAQLESSRLRGRRRDEQGDYSVLVGSRGITSAPTGPRWVRSRNFGASAPTTWLRSRLFARLTRPIGCHSGRWLRLVAFAGAGRTL